MPNLFPQTRFPQYGYKSWQEENVIRNEAQSPKFQEKDMWNRTIFRASMTYDLRKDDSLIVYGYWKQMRRLAQQVLPYSFDFFDFDDDIYFYEYVGNAVAAPLTQVFDVPGNKTRLWQWHHSLPDGTGMVSMGTSLATILTGTGVNGRDQISINFPDGSYNGRKIWISYTGRGCFDCVFLKRPDKSSPAYGRIGLQVEIVEKT